MKYWKILRATPFVGRRWYFEGKIARNLRRNGIVKKEGEGRNYEYSVRGRRNCIKSSERREGRFKLLAHPVSCVILHYSSVLSRLHLNMKLSLRTKNLKLDRNIELKAYHFADASCISSALSLDSNLMNKSFSLVPS